MIGKEMTKVQKSRGGAEHPDSAPTAHLSRSGCGTRLALPGRLAAALFLLTILLLPSSAWAGKEAGDSCDVFDPCGGELKCASGVCVQKNVKLTHDQRCDSLKSNDIAKSAKDGDVVMSFGVGSSSAAGASASLEEGVVYGSKGEFGCYVSACYGGVTDVGVSTFTNFGLYDSWENFAGESVVSSQGVSSPFIEAGFTTSQVWSEDTGRVIGSVNSVSFGVGIAPGQLGAVRCHTRVILGSQKGSALEDAEEQVVKEITYNRPEGLWCADEDGHCHFSGRKKVFFGVGDKWYAKERTSPAYCNLHYFGGDPNKGIAKQCFVEPDAPKGPTATSRESGIGCASEGGVCRFHGIADVYYGVGNQWRKQTVHGQVACDNATWGDPAPDEKKSCFVDEGRAPFTVNAYETNYLSVRHRNGSELQFSRQPGGKWTMRGGSDKPAILREVSRSLHSIRLEAMDQTYTFYFKSRRLLQGRIEYAITSATNWVGRFGVNGDNATNVSCFSGSKKASTFVAEPGKLWREILANRGADQIWTETSRSAWTVHLTDTVRKYNATLNLQSGKVMLDTGNGSGAFVLCDIKTASPPQWYSALATSGPIKNYPKDYETFSARVEHGIVSMRGLLRGTAHPHTRIATLPVHMRPERNLLFSALAPNGRLLRVDVNQNGSVYVYRGDSNYVSLSGISWSTPAAQTTRYTKLKPNTPIQNYGRSYKPFEAELLNGSVAFSGLLRGKVSRRTTISVLPPEMRPNRRLVFGVPTSGGGFSRLDVNTDGQVFFWGGSSDWVSISGVSFRTQPPDEVFSPTLSGTPVSNFGGSYRNFTAQKTGTEVKLSGMLRGKGDGTHQKVAKLPPSMRPSKPLIFKAIAKGNKRVRVDVSSTGDVFIYAGLDWLSLDGISWHIGTP